MKKVILPICFIIIVYFGLIITDLYNSGKIPIGWAYLACGLGFVGIIIAINGFVTQTVLKFRAIYERWFKRKK